MTFFPIIWGALTSLLVSRQSLMLGASGTYLVRQVSTPPLHLARYPPTLLPKLILLCFFLQCKNSHGAQENVMD